jgi:post-segregation antitoxin (ccd killing protein)
MVLDAVVRSEPDGCIPGRMPRMQVYLPDDLYQAVKDRRLVASELLQRAIRAECLRLDLLARTDSFADELADEVGEPSPAQQERAVVVGRRLARRPRP